MQDAKYDWLEQALFPPPRMVNSALWLHALPEADWLREVCADAGKLFVIRPDQQLAGGLIGVCDVSLVENYDPMRHVQVEMPDLSAGARRLKLGSIFDPKQMGDEVDDGVFGDIAVAGSDAGVVIGDDGTDAHILLSGKAVAKWPIADCRFFHPPATHGSDFMARITLFPDGRIDREAMTWLLGEVEES